MSPSRQITIPSVSTAKAVAGSEETDRPAGHDGARRTATSPDFSAAVMRSSQGIREAIMAHEGVIIYTKRRRVGTGSYGDLSMYMPCFASALLLALIRDRGAGHDYTAGQSGSIIPGRA